LIYKKRAYMCLKKNRDEKKMFYYMYKIASPVIFVFGFSSGFAATFWLWFVISIPFIRVHKNGTIIEL